MRDLVLEGALAIEIEVLTRIGSDPDYRPGYYIRRKLEAKGWVDTFRDASVLTIAGRTLVDMH